MRQVLFLVLYLLTSQVGYAYLFEEESENIGVPLHWDLDTYRNLKKLPELEQKNSAIVPLENLMDTPFREWEDLFHVHTVDSSNNIFMILISLPTKNLFNLENHFFTQNYLAADEETRKKFDILFNMLGIPKEDSIFGYYFFKKDHDSQQIRLDLPCISRVSKKETKHDEVARCLRTSAMYTYLSDNHCVLLNSFSREYAHQDVLDPTHGAIDLLLASEKVMKKAPSISYFGTSWGGIGVHLAHIEFYIKNILNQMECQPLAYHYSTINYMPVFQHGHEDHVDVPFVNVHGTDDDMCAFGITKRYGDEKDFGTVIFEGCGHNFHMFDDCEGEKLNINCTPFDEVGIKFRKELSRESAAEFIESLLKEGDGFFSGYFMQGDYHLELVNDPDSGNLLSWMELLGRLGKVLKKNIPYGSVESSYDVSLVITHSLWKKERNELSLILFHDNENVFYVNR